MSNKLRQRLLFRDLGTREQIDAILARGEVVPYATNDVICEEGAASDHLFFILEGSVEFFLRRGKGRKHKVYLDEQGAGEYFGEHGLFASAPRSASAQAKQATQCLVIKRDDFLEWLSSHADVALVLLKHASARIRDLSDELRALSGTAYERLVRYLTQTAVSDKDGRLVIADMPNTTQLAEQLDMSRKSCSQFLNDLERSSYIETRGHALIIKRPLPSRY